MMLKERYLQMKGTSYKFEVIHVPYPWDEFLDNELVGDMPWSVSPVNKLLPGGSAFLAMVKATIHMIGLFFLHLMGMESLLS